MTTTAPATRPHQVHRAAGVVLAVAALGIVGCSSPQLSNGTAAPAASAAPSTPAAAESTPVAEAGGDLPAPVAALIAAMNSGDRTAFEAVVAPDASFAYAGSTPKATAAERGAWLDSDIFGPQGRLEVDDVTTSPGEVTVTGRFTGNGWSGAADYTSTYTDGLVTGWTMR